MKNSPRGALTAIVLYLCFFCAPFGWGQESGNVLINTDPQGALVEVTGDMALSGVSPVKFDRNLSGKYVIEVSRLGYEKYHSINFFSSSQFSQLDISLVPKTRAKAAFRSLIIPGWGQRYYGNNTKSALFFLGTVVSAVGYVVAKDDYNSKRDDYINAKEAYEEATDWSDLSGLEAGMRDAQKNANDAEDMVNIMICATAGVYALNLLDSFLFFPQFDTFTEYKAITAYPRISPERVGITVAISF